MSPPAPPLLYLRVGGLCGRKDDTRKDASTKHNRWMTPERNIKESIFELGWRLGICLKGKKNINGILICAECLQRPVGNLWKFWMNLMWKCVPGKTRSEQLKREVAIPLLRNYENMTKVQENTNEVVLSTDSLCLGDQRDVKKWKLMMVNLHCLLPSLVIPELKGLSNVKRLLLKK